MSFSKKKIIYQYLPLGYILHLLYRSFLPQEIQHYVTFYENTPVELLSASSVNLHGITNSCVFHNNLRIRLSPLKSHILCKYTNPFKRCGMDPSISKCNAKRCKCCTHLSTKTTVTSSVNGRQFSVINNSELD